MNEGRTPGLIGLLGSGETAAAGGRLFERLAMAAVQPLRVAVLETPAGFELNSDRVAGRVADFLRTRLGNYQPEVEIVPARRRGTAFSPDDPAISDPVLRAGLLFAGPGSPTYAVRQLQASLAWDRVRARIGLGAGAVFASAAAIAIGRFALPVYEIYKAGHDLHWQAGLDLLGPFGLSLVVVPHWNNNDGGADLDTSRCFMGRSRFETLRELLPSDACIVGLDEHTALIMDVAQGQASVLGPGRVTVMRAGANETTYSEGDALPLERLGPFEPADLLGTVPEEVLAEAIAKSEAEHPAVPEAVLSLASEREAARVRRDWAQADRLREEIAALGWEVQDTAEGPHVLRGAARG